MFPQLAIVQALNEEKRNYTKLYTRVREILSEYHIRIAKQQYTDSLKPLIDSEIISKKKDEKSNSVIYSLSKTDYAQKQVDLIEEMGKVPELSDYLGNIVERSKSTFKIIQDSKEKNKKLLYSELNENLILVCQSVMPMILKMVLYQNKSIENLYLLKEIKKVERTLRSILDLAGELSKKLGKNNHDKFIDSLDTTVTNELNKKYSEFQKNNTLFKT